MKLCRPSANRKRKFKRNRMFKSKVIRKVHAFVCHPRMLTAFRISTAQTYIHAHVCLCTDAFFSPFLTRYSPFLTRYSPFTTRYLLFLTQNSPFLTRYSTFTTRYSPFFTRYSKQTKSKSQICKGTNITNAYK